MFMLEIIWMNSSVVCYNVVILKPNTAVDSKDTDGVIDWAIITVSYSS